VINLACLVGVSGPIAAGKSTLARGLAAQLGFAPVLEAPDRNPYLALYYREPAVWALRNYLFFFEQSLTDQVYARKTSTGVVQERLPQEHLEVFGREFHARGFLGDDDLALVERLSSTALSLVAPPSLLLHLDVPPDAAFERLRARSREAEASVSADYLEALGARYETFLANWTMSPLIRLDTAEVDLRRPEEVAAVADLVLRHLPYACRRLVQ
jgi:deoxyadenosine/deoxycytidine kinase